MCIFEKMNDFGALNKFFEPVSEKVKDSNRFRMSNIHITLRQNQNEIEDEGIGTVGELGRWGNWDGGWS